MTPAARLVRALLMVRDFVATAALVIVALPVWCLPRRTALRIGHVYGVIGFFVWPQGRRAGMINLRRAYGDELTRARARQIVWRVFGSLGQSVAEAIQFVRRFKHGPAGWTDVYEAEDPDLEKRVLRDPRPKIFVTAHLGSWEIATMLAGLRVGPTGAVIARRVDNPFLNALVRLVRFRRDSQWIDKRGGSAEALRRLRQGHSVAIVADETAGPRGVFVEFFGRPASTSRTPALLSLLTDSPIVIGVAVRRPDQDRLLMRLALVEPGEASDSPSPAIALTERITRCLEAWIRDDPEQWRWVHWRWKHRPDGREERYDRRALIECFAPAAEDDALRATNQEPASVDRRRA